jgi:hypothetical protein
VELRRLQHLILDRMLAGASLEEIEAELIDPAKELTEDGRSALWLYAWSFQNTSRQRYKADQLVRGLEGRVATD